MTTTTRPSRIQRRRTKGWRAEDHTTNPLGVVYVGRGTRWGNPWAVVQTGAGTGWAVNWAGHAGQYKPLGLNDHIPADNRRDAHAQAVELYENWLHAHPQLLDRARTELAGRDLMCWCAADLPCHVDALLTLANPGAQP